MDANDWVEETAEEISSKVVAAAVAHLKPGTTVKDLLKIAAMMGMSAGLARAQLEMRDLTENRNANTAANN